MPVPLEVEEAHFRDLGDPLLAYLRRITADPDTRRGRRHAGARLQRARSGCCTTSGRSTSRGCSLFEPRVILTSVPYRLG